MFVLFFGLCWHYDGFAAAWSAFFGTNLLVAILNFVGFYDWLIGMVLAVAIAFIVEALIVKRVKKRTVGLIVDAAAAIISLVGIVALFK